MRKVLETLDWLASQEDTEYDFHTFLEGWFLGAPTSALRRDNVVSFLAWAMYAKEIEDLSKGERKSALEMVRVGGEAGWEVGRGGRGWRGRMYSFVPLP